MRLVFTELDIESYMKLTGLLGLCTQLFVWLTVSVKPATVTVKMKLPLQSRDKNGHVEFFKS